jgi:hypothetical protein
MLIIILGKQEDETAAWLAERWRTHSAMVVSPFDLSQSGWVHYVGSPQHSRLRLGALDAGEEDVGGVLVRMASVEPQDLQHIAERDRAYVAAEMTAFLLAWLSGLACPVLNRPTSQSLGGPAFRKEQWVQFASRMGIPSAPSRRDSRAMRSTREDNCGCEVTVVGSACFGDADRILTQSARQLAASSGADLLSVSFTGRTADSEFVTANPWPDLRSPKIADAVMSCFEERSAC